ncbi:MAG: hypothetical protein M1142_06835 [Patescibacteria group bacterium]|nr:hypothetical protein [Patescibacteria group bacterium]
MKKYSFYKIPLWIVAASLLCFILNILFNGNPLTAFINVLILLLSWMLYKNIFVPQDDSNHLLYFLAALVLGAVPILSYRPEQILPSIILIICLLVLVFGLKLNFSYYPLIILTMIFLFLASILTSKMVEYHGGFKFGFDNNRFIFSSSALLFDQDIISKQRGELKVPLLVSGVLYNKPIFMAYDFFENIARFITLENLYISLTLINIYPFLLGVYDYLKNKRSHKLIIGSWIVVTLVIIGLRKSQDPLDILYLSAPLLLIFIFNGLPKIKAKYYLSLLLISFLLVFKSKL